MLNIDEFGGRTEGCPGNGHDHFSELIMHWIDLCTDPVAHTSTTSSTIAATPHAHQDQLVAVWIEDGSALPGTAR